MSDGPAERLAALEQNMEHLLTQKKQFQGQLVEVEAALEALETSETAYRIIGNLMVKQEPVKLKGSLADKKETLTVRISTLERQEEKIRSQVKEAQDEALADMKRK